MGILLAPGAGRGIAFAIIGAPLAFFLILGFLASSGASGAGNGSSDANQFPGYEPFSTTQSQPVYPQATPTSVPTTSDSGFAVPDATTDTSTAATDGAATDTPTSSASSSAATGPASVVVAAYADLNRHDYQDAYNLGLGHYDQTFQAFVAGYATTKSDTVTVTGVSGDVVSVSLAATKTDGSRHTYTGTYTVTDGVITGADIQQVN